MSRLKTISLILLCLLFVSYSYAAQPELLSKEAVGPLLSKPGQYFMVASSTHKSPDMQAKRRLYIKNFLGGESRYAHRVKKLNYSTPDQLAEEYIRAADGYMTTASSLTFFSELLKSRGIHSQPKIMNDVTLANGKHALLTAQDANILYGWTMSEIDRINSNKKPPSIDGRYKMAMKGHCPFDNGDIDIVQNGFIVEGRRNDALMFWGSIGKKVIYIQFAETKYYEVYGPKEHMTEHYPGRPSDIYSAALNTNRIEFAGIHYKECMAVLTRNRQ